MKFKSQYKRLSFTVNGERKKFSEGIFETDNKDEIAVLENMRDVEVVEDKKAAAAPTKKTAEKAAAPKK